MFRIICPNCRLIFLRVETAGEEGVTCPRCQVVFHPDEEELFDPEND